MGGLRVKNEVILFRTESSYGVDPVPVQATHAVLVQNPTLELDVEMVNREAVRAGLGDLQQISGKRFARMSFACEVKGSGTAGTAPEIGPLLEACGLEETVVAVTSVTYAPEDGAHESGTIYYFEGGRKRHILTGCRGTVTLRLEAGGLLMADFVFTGHYSEPTDQTQPTPTYNTTVPRAALSMAISLNGVTAIVARSWQWALNNEIALPPSVAAADGYGEIILTGRPITGEIFIESELDSVIDVEALLFGGTRFAFASGTLGSVAGNRVAVTTPASSTYVSGSSPHDAGEGLRLRRVPLKIDDAVATGPSIAFT